MLILFLENVPRDTLIWQQHGHGFFHKYQDWNKGKRWKKREICQFPLEYVVSQVYLLFALLKYNHRYFFFTLNDLYSMLKITLISVLLIFVYQMHIFFCFFRNYLKSQTVSSMSLPTNMLIRQQHAYCFFAVLRSNTLIRPTLSFGSQEYIRRSIWADTKNVNKKILDPPKFFLQGVKV